MSFCWATLHVRDLDASLRFYQEVAGLSVRRRIGAAPGPQMVFLGAEGDLTEIELISDGKNQPKDMGSDVSIGFNVKSLDDQIALVRGKGVAITGGPISPNPRVRFFFVKDPDGLTVQFVENLR